MGSLQDRIKDYIDLDSTVEVEPTAEAKSTLKERIDEYLNAREAGGNSKGGRHGQVGAASTRSSG